MVNSSKKTVLFGSKKAPKKLYGSSRTARYTASAKRPRRHWLAAANVVAALALLYSIAVFSNIPFIKTYRELYIETAMDTYSHKWLATRIIPGYVIDDVMAKKEAFIAGQQSLQSAWDPTDTAPDTAPGSSSDVSEPPTEANMAEMAFLDRFDELDPASFHTYIEQHPDTLVNGYDKLLINEATVGGDGTSIYTSQGDQVVVLDAENGILITVVKGDGYEGKLAMIKNPDQVRLGVAATLGTQGQVVSQIAKNNHALLAINASGFADPQWKGNGGQVVGLLIADGVTYNTPIRNGYLNIGFGYDDRLYIGQSTKDIEYRDAVEFMPAIIINGENVTDGSTGFGIQPRSVIGQAEDGTVFLLTIDGRQVGYSLGTTVGVCADILLRYGAVQASNLDGGSSTIMIYRDEIITRPSSTTNLGRYVPDAFIVDYAGE